MREHAAHVRENEVQHRVLDDAAVAYFQDVRQIPSVTLAYALHVRIQPGLERAVAEPAHHLAQALRVAGRVRGPAFDTDVPEIVLQTVFDDPRLSDQENFRLYILHANRLFRFVSRRIQLLAGCRAYSARSLPWYRKNSSRF